MKHLILISLLFCLAISSYPAESADTFDASEEDQEVNFDHFEEEEGLRREPLIAVDGLKFNLYIDLSLQTNYQPIKANDNLALTFNQDHHHFLVRASYKDYITANLDLANNFNQITIQLKPDNFLFFGKILVPFGNIEYHHIYGGTVDESSIFLPTTWSNLGAGYRRLLFNRNANLALYVLNGFSAPGAQMNFTDMASPDSNNLKAFGLRYQHQILSGLNITASVLADFPADDNNWRDHQILYGLDAILKLKAFTFSAGFTLHEAYLKSLGEITRFLFPASYLRTGSYAEARYDFTKNTAIRLRFGHIDPNSEQRSKDARMNANIGLILNFDVIQIISEYNVMMHLYPDTSYEDENYKNTLRINAIIQL